MGKLPDDGTPSDSERLLTVNGSRSPESSRPCELLITTEAYVSKLRSKKGVCTRSLSAGEGCSLGEAELGGFE